MERRSKRPSGTSASRVDLDFVGIAETLVFCGDCHLALMRCIVTGFGQLFGRVAGASEKVAQRAAQAGRHWYRGIANGATPLDE
jgi:hypothetical protein